MTGGPSSSRAVSALEEARQAYVAMEDQHGPHVTPELFCWSDDRLWFASAASTLKAKVLRDDVRVAVLARAAARDVQIQGRIERFDIGHPLGLVQRTPRLPAALRATIGFTIRNASDLLAFGRDVASGRLGRPRRRILFAVVPDRVDLLENDALDGQPSASAVPIGGERAVVGLPGPAALPGRWFGDERRLVVVPELLDRHRVDGTVDVAVVVDQYNAPGPSAKAGALLRGTAVRNGTSTLVVDVQRCAEWS